MKAYSIDFRQKIINAYKDLGSFRNIAKRFCVSRSFVQKIVKQYKDTGRVLALAHGGGQKSKFNSEHIDILQKIVMDNNDATLSELCKVFSHPSPFTLNSLSLRKGYLYTYNGEERVLVCPYATEKGERHE